MKRINNAFKELSLTTQIIITIILVFVTFFLLQLFLNGVFFRTYYINNELSSFETDFIDLKQSIDEDPYDSLYTFSYDTHTSILTLDSSFNIIHSDPYHIEVISDNQTYLISGLDVSNTYEINTMFTGYVAQNNSNYYQFMPTNCDACTRVEGEIISLYKPDNLNILFQNIPGIQEAVQSLSTLNINDYVTDDGYIIPSTEQDNAYMFITDYDGGYLMSYLHLQDTNRIIQTVSSYQNFVYLTAIVVIVLWSFRIAKVISKPIKIIESMSREIAALNFDVEVKAFYNKETTSLSQSITLIASNMKETIETINNKNQELTKIYKEQTKQTNLKKQLVSSLSHELKTPLMIMQVTLQGILDGVVKKEEQANEINNVLQEIQKSSQMIQDMLQIYRLEDKTMKLNLSDVDISTLTNTLLDEFHPLIKQQNFKLTKNIEENVMLQCDQLLLRRVISNFIMNAIKYTPEHETIHVEIKKSSNTILFSLYNQGVTIDEENIKKVWLPFYKGLELAENNTNYKSSGIGLYLVSEILKAHKFPYGIKNVKQGVEVYFKASL